MRRCRRSSTRSCRTPARRAAPARGCWSSDRATSALLELLGERFARSRVGPALADLDCGPLIRASQLARVRGFLDERDARRHRHGRGGTDRRRCARRRLLRRADTAARRARRRAGSRATKCSDRCSRRCRSPTRRDAIALANATDYGLVAGVWTRDGGRQLRMARALQSGQVFVNNYGAGGGVELPFGGVKHSGLRPRKGFRGAVRFHDAEDRRAAPWLTRCIGYGRLAQPRARKLRRRSRGRAMPVCCGSSSAASSSIRCSPSCFSQAFALRRHALHADAGRRPHGRTHRTRRAAAFPRHRRLDHLRRRCAPHPAVDGRPRRALHVGASLARDQLARCRHDRRGRTSRAP